MLDHKKYIFMQIHHFFRERGFRLKYSLQPCGFGYNPWEVFLFVFLYGFNTQTCVNCKYNIILCLSFKSFSLNYLLGLLDYSRISEAPIPRSQGLKVSVVHIFSFSIFDEKKKKNFFLNLLVVQSLREHVKKSLHS